MTAPTPSLRDVAQQALDALEYHKQQTRLISQTDAAIESLRAALALPEPDPVAYDQTALELCNVCGWKTLVPGDGCLNCERKAAPVERQPLTDGKIDCVAIEQWGEMRGYPLSAHRAYARAIEAAHGIGAA